MAIWRLMSRGETASLKQAVADVAARLQAAQEPC